MADSADIVAWRHFCTRIQALGEEVLTDDYRATPADRAEGVAHLADQVSCWLGWAIGHGDTTAPFFHRSNDLVTQWGGPKPGQCLPPRADRPEAPLSHPGSDEQL